MQYNSYYEQFSVLDKKLKALKQTLGELESTQKWYEKFDLGVADSALSDAKQLLSQVSEEIKVLEPKIENRESDVAKLKKKASLGWNPKYWFSAERAAHKVELGSKKSELNQLHNRLDILTVQFKDKSNIIVSVENDLLKHSRHDPQICKSKIDDLNQEMGALALSLNEVARKRDELDVQLNAPLTELKKLTAQRSNIAADIIRAQSMDEEMSRAANGYQRAQIHEKSKQVFGDPSPRKVKGARERELDGIDRNIKKLQTRLEAIADKSSRVIRRLVIDGNNMCYTHSTNKFLGLSALRPLANLLAEKYEVLVVFDADIREQLRKNDRQIVDCFSNRVRVHIVAFGEKADESILKIASGNDDWVISGDRFGDYPEMPAVRNKRLLRHEILEKMVLINDLGVELSY